MTDQTLRTQSFNAQTQRVRDAVRRGERLSTRRTGPLGQLFFCEGCCCGRSEKGFPPLPKESIKERWKSLNLNKTIQLTISGCLGPCDLANVCYLLSRDGTGQWLGGLSEAWHYQTLIRWAIECRSSGSLLPIPATLDCHRFTRFDSVPVDPQTCSLGVQKPRETAPSTAIRTETHHA